MVTVNGTDPLWFYCAQTLYVRYSRRVASVADFVTAYSPIRHCQAGMVFAVNPSADESFASFHKKAMAPVADSEGILDKSTPSHSPSSPSADSSASFTNETVLIDTPTPTPTSKDTYKAGIFGLLLSGVSLVTGLVLS